MGRTEHCRQKGQQGEDQEQQRPLVQSRKNKPVCGAEEEAEWGGKVGLVGPCGGFQAPPKSKWKPPLSKGFLFLICKPIGLVEIK